MCLQIIINNELNYSNLQFEEKNIQKIEVRDFARLLTGVTEVDGTELCYCFKPEIKDKPKEFETAILNKDLINH